MEVTGKMIAELVNGGDRECYCGEKLLIVEGMEFRGRALSAGGLGTPNIKESLVQKCTGGFLFYKLKFSIVFACRIVKIILFKCN